MKYEEESRKFLREIFSDVWEEDWEEFEKELFESSGMSYEDLSRDLEIGVENGHSIEFQLDLMKKLIEEIKDEKRTI